LGNNEGKFEKFKSNYIDERNEPLFPFGFGLSYTNFEYSNFKLSSVKINLKNTLKVTIDIANTGSFDGKEIVQLYIRDLFASVTRPVKELKGFQKINLKKGEKQTVTFEISAEDLKFYNAALQFVAEPGKFEVFVGSNSDTNTKATFELVN
jgi:beta-glucosidase